MDDGVNWGDFITKKLMVAIEKKAEEAQELIAKTAVNVVSYSPTEGDSKGGYATGEFLANWQIDDNLNGNVTTVAQPSKELQIAQMVSDLKRVWDVKKDKNIYVFNNSPYSKSVEYGVGWPVTEGYYPRARAVAEIK